MERTDLDAMLADYEEDQGERVDLEEDGPPSLAACKYFLISLQLLERKQIAEALQSHLKALEAGRADLDLMEYTKAQTRALKLVGKNLAAMDKLQQWRAKLHIEEDDEAAGIVVLCVDEHGVVHKQVLHPGNRMTELQSEAEHPTEAEEIVEQKGQQPAKPKAASPAEAKPSSVGRVKETLDLRHPRVRST